MSNSEESNEMNLTEKELTKDMIIQTFNNAYGINTQKYPEWTWTTNKSLEVNNLSYNIYTWTSEMIFSINKELGSVFILKIYKDPPHSYYITNLTLEEAQNILTVVRLTVISRGSAQIKQLFDDLLNKIQEYIDN